MIRQHIDELIHWSGPSIEEATNLFNRVAYCRSSTVYGSRGTRTIPLTVDRNIDRQRAVDPW